jgi:hypothetical protein
LRSQALAAFGVALLVGGRVIAERAAVADQLASAPARAAEQRAIRSVRGRWEALAAHTIAA